MNITILKEVEELVLTFQKPTRSKWLQLLSLLCQYGNTLGMSYVRYISHGMKELRVRGEQEVRALFVIRGDQITIVHAFIKKTQKTSKREIDTAFKRLAWY